jgi:hypothetical protein
MKTTSETLPHNHITAELPHQLCRSLPHNPYNPHRKIHNATVIVKAVQFTILSIIA